MPSEWRTFALEEICSRIFSGGTPRSTVAEYYASGDVPWLKTKEVNYRKIYSTESKITQLGLANSSARLVPVNSVIVAMYGDGNTAGRVAINKIPLTTNQACCNLQVNPLLADYRFVYYALKGKYQELVDLKNGGGQQNLSAQLIKRFSISFPEVNIQTEIANLLESLDDRIDSLQQSNETLEAMARAIFKAWFVDFEPVRAKAEGRQPDGMDEATAALFPSEFQDSELGPIPQGWSAGALEERIQVNPGRTLRKGETAPYLDMANAPTSGPSVTDITDRPLGSGCKFMNGDTLLAKITPCLENGKTAFVDFLEPNQVGWGSTEFIVLAPIDPIPAAFGYLLARDPVFRNYAEQSMTGTSGRQRVPPEQIKRYRMAFATDEVYVAFAEIVAPIFSTITVNAARMKTLAALRDSLLPRLISGKLRVPEAEAMLSEVL